MERAAKVAKLGHRVREDETYSDINSLCPSRSKLSWHDDSVDIRPAMAGRYGWTSIKWIARRSEAIDAIVVDDTDGSLLDCSGRVAIFARGNAESCAASAIWAMQAGASTVIVISDKNVMTMGWPGGQGVEDVTCPVYMVDSAGGARLVPLVPFL